MKEFWYTIQFIFTVLGGWIGYFLGGCDGLLIALVAFHLCTCRSSQSYRCAGDTDRQHTQNSGDIFLPLKRGCIISGKRSTSWTSHSEKAERSSGTAARQTQ